MERPKISALNNKMLKLKSVKADGSSSSTWDAVVRVDVSIDVFSENANSDAQDALETVLNNENFWKDVSTTLQDTWGEQSIC